MMFREYDIVRLRQPHTDGALKSGALGTVVMVYDDGAAYEVEFCDDNGVTLALLTLKEEDLERSTDQEQ